MNDKYYWLNTHSRQFLERGYLKEGVTPEKRIRQIADHAEKLLGMKGFADKFEDYMARGFYSLSLRYGQIIAMIVGFLCRALIHTLAIKWK